MSTRNQSTTFAASAEAAELYRDVVSMVVHDLGGVSSALGLRTEALSSILPNGDRLALQGITEQLRDVTRMLRLLQGPRTNELLSPMKEASVRDWWRLVPRLLAAVLPRNIAIEHHIGTATLTSAEASTLSTLLMLAGRDLTAKGLRGPAGLRVDVSSDEALERGTQVRLAISLSDWPATGTRRSVKRWSRYAERIAGKAGAIVEWWTEREGAMVWRCSIGGK